MSNDLKGLMNLIMNINIIYKATNILRIVNKHQNIDKLQIPMLLKDCIVLHPLL